MNDNDNDQKEYVRSIVLNNVPRASSVLMMPGHAALDVKLCLERGIIDHDTDQIWVERQRAEQIALRMFASEMGFSRVTIYPAALERMPLTVPIDFANIDTMGRFTDDLGMWIENVLSPRLTPQSTVIVTVTKDRRRGDFLDEFVEWFPRARPDLWDLAKKQLGQSDELLLVPFIGLYLSLRAHDIEPSAPHVYRGEDNQFSMISMKVLVGRRIDPVLPSWSGIADDFHASRGSRTIGERTVSNAEVLRRLREVLPKHLLDMQAIRGSNLFQVFLLSNGQPLATLTLTDLCRKFL